MTSYPALPDQGAACCSAADRKRACTLLVDWASTPSRQRKLGVASAVKMCRSVMIKGWRR